MVGKLVYTVIFSTIRIFGQISQPNLLAHWQAHTSQRSNQRLAKELTKPTLVTTFKGCFRICQPTKNRINSCFVTMSVRIDNIKD